MNDDRIFRKCAWRLLPFITLLYAINFIDRINVGFAALTMNRDLGLSPRVFGFGAGVFFVGYLVFQVPANAILIRLGARLWIFIMLAVWGITSSATAFVQHPLSFYSLRFLLGTAEAGLFPAMILYLTCWFPHSYRARLAAIVIAGGPIANIIVGPLSVAILGMDGTAGLHGWQWLFLLEGLPAFLISFAVFKLLPAGPSQAPWLSEQERTVVADRVAAEPSPADRRAFWSGLRDFRVLALGVIYFGIVVGIYGFDIWLPQIIQGLGFSNRLVGFLVMVPFCGGAMAQVLWGWSSDRRGERIWHIAIPALAAAVGFLGAGYLATPFLVIAALTLARTGMNSTFGPFWSLPFLFLGGRAAAGGIGIISTIAYLGGFVGPAVLGILRQQSGGYASGMAAMALALTFSAVVVLALGRAMAPTSAVITAKRVGA